MNSLIKYTCDFQVNDTRPFTQQLSEFLDTSNGRDKLFRLVQYYVKLVLPFIKEKNEYVKVCQFLEGISGASSLARKVSILKFTQFIQMLRLGKQVNLFRAIMNRFKHPACAEYNDVIKSLSDLCNSIYFVLDHILLLNKVNAVKFESRFIARVDWWSNIFWGGECFTNFGYDLVDYTNNARTLREFINSIKKIENKETFEYKALYEKISLMKYEQFKIVLDMIRCLTDMPVNIYLMFLI